MSSLKTILALVFITMGGSASATSLTYVFASCTGRFSAEVEHAWLMRDPQSQSYEIRRQRFEDLLFAVSPEGGGGALLDQRIKAKAAHARMLQMGQFSQNHANARWAKRRAAAEIGYCETFLLES